MATFLSGMRDFCFRRRGLVVLLWIIALGGMGFAVSALDTFSMPGTKSQQAFDLLQEAINAAAPKAFVTIDGTPAVHRPRVQRLPGQSPSRRAHRARWARRIKPRVPETAARGSCPSAERSGGGRREPRCFKAGARAELNSAAAPR
ncbi:hypothetical protein [Micromonospora sp. 067-2]|uniref:hypothetical protein n=1 Tax=Micromonospora sp. 067-2 TaxID=2789270 RepID=UPI00397816AE